MTSLSTRFDIYLHGWKRGGFPERVGLICGPLLIIAAIGFLSFGTYLLYQFAPIILTMIAIALALFVFIIFSFYGFHVLSEAERDLPKTYRDHQSQRR